MKKIVICAMLLASGCVSASSNLSRIQAECAIAPLASIGNSLIPVPGVGGVLNYTISQVCANPQLVANDEASVAAVVSAIALRIGL